MDTGLEHPTCAYLATDAFENGSHLASESKVRE
jgi:hypothetical protein